MSQQRYYKMISLNQSDLTKPRNNIETTPWKLSAKLSSWLFTGTLNESLETIKLEKVCNARNKVFASASLTPDKKKSTVSDLCLGYQTILISLCLHSGRELLYKNGFLFNGIHYVRYKRSASSAKEGTCLFIQEEFFEEMMTWSSCGLNPKEQSLQTDFQAYISLTLSGIKGTFKLPANSILLIDDVKSNFTDEVMQVSISNTPENGTRMDATLNSKAEIENTIWDGQAMLDDNVFNKIAGFEDKSMLLLRNRFLKTCAFRTRLQKWFTDNGITSVDQLNGFTKATDICDIKLVITTSSLKYYKFLKDNFTLEEIFYTWLKNLGEKNLTFGIVKSDFKTKYMDGKMCRTSYQFMATLGLSQTEVYQLLKPSLDYLENMKSDPTVFRHYTKMNATSLNPEGSHDTIYLYEVCNYMTAITNRFASTKLYREFFYRETDRFREHLKCGEILIDGTYATLFGNGIEFLYATIHKDYNPNTTKELYDKDNQTLPTLNGNQVYTSFFEPGTQICCYRSPHITMGNLLLAKVEDNSFIKTYFCLSENIICVNAIEHNIMHRLNGADYDSDFVLITNNATIVESVSKFYPIFPVPYYSQVSSASSATPTENVYNSPANLAKIDNAICKNLIGYISNLAFILNNMLWDRLGETVSSMDISQINAIREIIYSDKNQILSEPDRTVLTVVSELEGFYQTLTMLAVLCGLEIDKAKRAYDFDMLELFENIKTEMSLLMQTFPVGAKNTSDSLTEDTSSSNAILVEELPTFIEKIIGQNSKRTLNISKQHTCTTRTEWNCTLSHLFSYKFKETHYRRGNDISLTELISGYSKDENASHQKGTVLSLLTQTTEALNSLPTYGKGLSSSQISAVANQRQRILNDFFAKMSKVTVSEHAVHLLLGKADSKKLAPLFAQCH